MNPKEVPSVTANGATIPVVGFGTWQLRDESAVRNVAAALEAGYRHIDTAAMYDNEEPVGEALKASGLPRDELFVTTKVWSAEVGDGNLQRSAEASLKRLGLDHVDLLLIHWPSRDIAFAEQIGALCDAKARGLTRHIGVSNFPPLFVKKALEIASEPIVVNQVEHHPYLDQGKLFDTCRANDIAITSYSPIGRGAVLKDPVIVGIARSKGRSAAQIVLRWHVQHPKNIVIPRSSDPERIAANLEIFDFQLDDDDMARISALARPDGRMVNTGYPSDWDGAPES